MIRTYPVVYSGSTADPAQYVDVRWAEAAIKEREQRIAELESERYAIVKALGCHPAHILDEIAQLSERADTIPNADEVRQLRAERDALKAENAALREDAERYRWLTDDHADGDMRARVRLVAGSIDIHGKGYTDAAIDAAKGE